MRPFRFVDVERRILQQHEEIRARIHGLENLERIGLPFAEGALSVLLLRFAAFFDAHLAFEERELAPRIRELDAWGGVREAALRCEHRAQRTRLEQVCALAEGSGVDDVTRLFRAISDLAADLLEDMVEEERTLAELARIAEHGHVDQMTG